MLKWLLLPIPVYFGGVYAGKYLIDEQAKMSFTKRCKLVGLGSEKHFVTTEDGYILQLFRVTSGESQSECPPVYFQHGSQSSAMDWVANKEKSSPFILAKNGYDVWVANARGCAYSQFHKYLDPNEDPEYWDFCFEDMAKYDTKAVIEYIRKNNDHKSHKVSYIGHSQGSAMILIALSEDLKWYQDKLSIAIACAPATRMDAIKAKTLKKVCENESVHKLINKATIHQMHRPNAVFNGAWCGLSKLCPPLMKKSMKKFNDADPTVNNLNSCQIFWYHHPSGTSFKALKHWSQIIKHGEFIKFDYGKEKNLEVYGTETPPMYDLVGIQKSKIPIAILSGKHDLLAATEDCEWTKAQLGESLVFDKEYDYGHMTFLCGKDNSYIYDIMKLLKEYSQ
ncbi:unnamed protein product [Moneuplotes crassus]|uniref:Lipase n=1 Tax=Euplotes crassus TaxID=5936 RepID=A0AAD1XGA5_EUPCR|nr:unnamed protein product [Moneuplotes crassus]